MSTKIYRLICLVAQIIDVVRLEQMMVPAYQLAAVPRIERTAARKKVYGHWRALCCIYIAKVLGVATVGVVYIGNSVGNLTQDHHRSVCVHLQTIKSEGKSTFTNLTSFSMTPSSGIRERSVKERCCLFGRNRNKEIEPFFCIIETSTLPQPLRWSRTAPKCRVFVFLRNETRCVWAVLTSRQLNSFVEFRHCSLYTQTM